MSNSIENVVMENVVVNVKVKAKSFAQKDKKTLFSIMAFIKFLEEQGILPDDKTLECLNALPLYKTAAEKTAFFQQDMFDTVVVENELYKPMVSDYKNAKKEKKTEKKPKEEKPKKERKPKEKKVVDTPEPAVEQVKVDKPKKERKPKEKKVVVVTEPTEVVVTEPTEVVVTEPTEVVVTEQVKVDKPKKERKPKEKKEGEDTEAKRGRKPKQQIVELAQDVVLVEEDPLDVLIQAMNTTETPVPLPDSVPVPEEWNVDDVEAMMAELELEAEEIVEKKMNTTPILKEKKKIETDPVKVSIIKKSKKAKDVVVEK
jgi:hypothetical protein